jgi:Secretion system C-terminal sorting domain
VKNKSFLKLILTLALSFNLTSWSQITTAGDIAFTAINVDGDDDFAFVALVDISANTTLYFTDKTWDNTNSIFINSGSDGFLSWNSGASVIKAGTVVVFTDTDNSANPRYGASVGTLSSPENVILVATGETLFAYLGTDQNTPTTFIAGIKNATLTAGELTGTGLTAGTNFLEFNPTTSPDGGYYSASRTSQTVYSNYLSLINNKTNWTRQTTNGEAILPISTTGFTISTTTWTGTNSTDWTVSANWNNGVPDNSFQVVIPNVTNKPIINSGTNYTVGNLTIDAGSSLTINAGKGLTVSGTLNNNGTFTVNSDATTGGSLIVTESAAGSITYNRYITGVDKWHLISAPVGGQSINGFVTNTGNNVGTSGVNYSVTPYDNSFSKGSASAWTHWTTDGSGGGNMSGAGNFITGKGYEILTTADGTVAFTGTVSTSDVSIAVTKPASNNAWNLIGNPFPSSIFANSAASEANNFISINASALDASYQAIYLWNPGAGSYDLINQASGATYIAPGQGFFVKSISGGSTVNFTTAMRINQSSVTFQKLTVKEPPSIMLIVSNDVGKIRTTTIKYMANATLGLDPGYDAGRFDAGADGFGIYSRLVNDNGIDFMQQVLPDSVYDTTVIPIGLEANLGAQITFKAQISNLPVGKKVYLEDRLLGLFTELNDTDKRYTISLTSDANGVGRFYLYTLDNLSTLAVKDTKTSKFKVISQPQIQSIRIIGDLKQKATLKLYDSLGRFIYTTKLDITADQNVSLPRMTKGVYFIKIQSSNINYSTKIAWY